MAESRDYRIVLALMERLKTIKKINGYEIDVNKVFIPKKNIAFDTYPAIAVFWNENHLDDEGFYKENSSLDVVLVYVDGIDDDNTEESYYVRLRNAGPSIRSASWLIWDCRDSAIKSRLRALRLDYLKYQQMKFGRRT
jgi:hypothetical protein